MRREVDESVVLELVKAERCIQPRVGARKLHRMFCEEFDHAGVKIGRDRMFEVLRKHDLLIEPKKNTVRTTDSRHWFGTYTNLFRDCVPQGPHEAWVCDLTYIRTDEGFVYASLVTDAFSRKIVGDHVGESLEASGCRKALSKALGQLPADQQPIHHSDRGLQYCCREYVGVLKQRGLSISMTEKDHCAENAMAERVNGILKQEYGLNDGFRTKQDAYRAFDEAVWLYNERRLHSSLGYRTPQSVHEGAA